MQAEYDKFVGRACRALSKRGIEYIGVLKFIDGQAQRITIIDGREFPVGNPEYFRSFAEVSFGVEELAEFSFTDQQPAQAPPPTTSAPSHTASTSIPSAAQPSPATANRPTQPTQATAAQQQPPVNVASFSAEKAMPAGWNGYGQQGTQPQPQPPTQQYNPNLNAGAQTESLDRAMGAMKLNNGVPSQPKGATGAASGSGSTQYGRHTPRGGGGDRGGRRGRGGNRGNGHPSHQAAQELKIPTTDFDFQANNNRFVKTSIPKPQQVLDGTSPDGTTPTTADAPENATATLSSEAAVDDAANATEKKEDEKAYNPSKSFFDNISSDLSTKKAPPKPAAAGAAPGDRGPSRGGNNNGGGRGRGGGRSRRDEERERNLETFGEPGGVGMMGPGAYVGGYGGYRGKRRRGGPGARGSRGGAPKAIAQHSG